MLIYSSPQLFAVSHVLLRLLMPRHSPYALVRLNFPIMLFSFELYEFHLNMVFYLLFVKRQIAFFLNVIPPFGEIVVITLNIGKTLNSIDL